ncbi:MAG: glycosyltransferase [Thermoplasmata archaeon]|nr:glycosyltransferase [Thermoplasmata archaeon]
MGTEPGNFVGMVYAPSPGLLVNTEVRRLLRAPSWGSSDRTRDGLSLVIPAYNEEDRIRPTLVSYLDGIATLKVPYEVIVVIDGQDDTAGVVREFASRGVRAVEFTQKLGRGGAIFEGFRQARFGTVAYADADGSIPISDGLALIRRALQGSPAVVASRRLAPESVVVPESSTKRFASLTWFLLVKAFLGVRVKDSHCGFKVFDREVVQMLLRRVTVTNRTFEVGMMYHVGAAGVPIEEVPVGYIHDERTRMPLGKAIPVMFATLLGMFLANRTRLSRRVVGRLGRRFNTRFASV